MMNTSESLLDEHFDQLALPDDLVIVCDVSEESETIFLEVELPNIDQWSTKQESASQERRDYLAHIHSLSFRIVNETFLALPWVKQVIYSGFMLNSCNQRGQKERVCFLSVVHQSLV